MSFSKSIKFDTCVYLRLSFAVDLRIHRYLPREIERKISSKVDRLYVFAWFTHSQICTQALKTLGELRERERGFLRSLLVNSGKGVVVDKYSFMLAG